jgi:hypothetical protein
LTDPSTGTSRHIGFFGSGSDRLFGCLHLPSDAPRAGVLICPPLAGEFEKNYRRETMLAGALATRGIAVQRFHYRGTGHSDGEAVAITFDSLVEDALTAAHFLRARASVELVGVVGTRLGALVAASARAGSALVCWEPILDGERYFRELVRLTLMRSLRKGVSEAGSSHDALERLRRDGWLDVLGHTIGLPLYDTLTGRTLVDALEGTERDVLLIQLSQDAALREGYRRALAGMKGRSGEIKVIPEQEPWWFGEHRRGRRALTAATTDWLGAILGRGDSVAR